jgi:hypothetical protein
MAHEKLTEDPFLLSVKSLEYVVDKKIEPLFKSTIRKSREYINNTQFVSIKEHILGYLLEREYYTWMDFGVKVDVRSNLEEISKHLDMVYWIEKLKLSSWALSQRKTGNHQYQIRHSEELVQNLKDYPLDLIPELAIYYYSHLTLLDESEESHYYKLRNLLDQYGQSIPQDEAIGLFDSALNYCIGKINKGNHAFQIEYFELFEDILKKEIFIVNGELATWRFNNMVAAALRLDKLDWAESFIQKYHIYLSPESRANTYSFNLARVYRFQGKYSEVIKILQNVEYEDIGHNLISKAVLLITYYELQEFETLLHFTTAFRTFLNRHKNIPAARRQGYLNLIKYTRRLIRLDFSDAAAVARLREEITREKASTINHEWLLEKLSGTSR